jgi:hypothetical protein
MKKLILICTLFSTLNISLIAGEFTGAGAVVESVLKRNNLSMAGLRRDGFKVLLGEVTGAGKAVPLDALKFIVTKKDLMPMSEVTHINFKSPSAAKNLSDIKALEFNLKRVSAGNIKAVIFR